ncbi:MerR family transcriptional regulator [Kitasatospora viridis]|uniref:Protein phosphatase n=1 Tax=Kitasatospora viridis TaxID=281105 RepID=A0A561UP29_9ACTN|nr:MerR family transcriptional regulator [Kitasatospora viridis]TWG01136.1 protein phosphatase [Kitasatospora viridis]
MERLTIGAFARACGLSPKALRLYDELDLLRPDRVDPLSGYRYYRPEQLERARLVAHLRRIGVPLARIRHLVELTPAQAADELTAHWHQVLAETAARQELVTLLTDHLRGRPPVLAEALTLRCAARSDLGLVRERNDDHAYADAGLLAVADGFGSPAAGSAAIAALRAVDPAAIGPGGLLTALDRAVRESVADTPEDMGTTLTALLAHGDQLALVHIGDSRAYLLREGELFRITHDHTWVQSLVDEGRLTAEEAASHPQRTLLIRALTGGTPGSPDLSLLTARSGDRYLLCSDGLSRVVPEAHLHTVLSTVADPDRAVEQLVELANRAGGPDNIACAVADVLPAA